MKRYFLLGCIVAITPIMQSASANAADLASRPLLVPLMCHVRLIGLAAPVGVGAAAAAAVFLRPLRRAVAAAVGAVAVGAASNGAAAVGPAAVGAAAVGVAVVGVVGNLRIKKAGCRRNQFFDRRRRAVRTRPW